MSLTVGTEAIGCMGFVVQLQAWGFVLMERAVDTVVFIGFIAIVFDDFRQSEVLFDFVDLHIMLVVAGLPINFSGEGYERRVRRWYRTESGIPDVAGPGLDIHPTGRRPFAVGLDGSRCLGGGSDKDSFPCEKKLNPTCLS